MLGMNKVLTIAIAALALGTTNRPANLAPANEPQPSAVDRQQQQLDVAFESLKTERARLAEQRKKNSVAKAIIEAEDTITVSVGGLGVPRPYRVKEVVNGKDATLTFTSLDLLTKYLTRVRNDPNGPKQLAIHGVLTNPAHGLSPAVLSDLSASCAAAGYEKGLFWYTISVEGLNFRDAPWVHETAMVDPDNYWPGPGHVVDLKTYGLRGGRNRTVEASPQPVEKEK